MQLAADMGINEDHQPGEAEERVLEIFKREREELDESRMTPQLIRDRMDDPDTKQTVNYALRQLVAAGWVTRPADGLYQFERDPRGD